MVTKPDAILSSGDNTSLLTKKQRSTYHKTKAQTVHTQHKLRRDRSFLFMALPGILFLIVFAYIPMVGLIIAFKDYRAYEGILGSAWVGLQNFRFLFATKDAWHITFNTLYMNGLFIVSGTVIALLLALLLNEVREKSPVLSGFYQSTLFFPYFISYVIVSYFINALLSSDAGLLNRLIIHLGLQPINWYASPGYWPLILVLVNLWKGVGFGCIMYLAGIVSINPEYFEAASIDGASKWQQIWNITLPLLKPVLIVTTLIAIGRIFYADFGLFFIIPGDTSQLYPATDVIDTYVYRMLTTLGDVGMSSAAGFYQSVIGFLLVLLSNWFVRRIDPDKALF